MRLSQGIAFAAVLSLAVLGAADCSRSQKQTVETKEGPATVETNKQDQTATITNKEGTAKIGKNAVDPQSLGLPIYPGASVSEGGGMSAVSSKGSAQLVVMTTSDSFDKVYEWYKGQMPAGSEKMHLSTGGSSIATFQVGETTEKDQKGVMIAADKDKTTITLSHGQKP